MRIRVVRCIVLVCNLSLVLPPGWCCILQPEVCAEQQSQDAPKARRCCGHCKPAAPAKAPRPADAPVPKPDPVAPGECPCTERQTTRPAPPKSVTLDLSLVAPL